MPFNTPIDHHKMVGIPADQNSPKWRSTGNIWNLAYWISDSLLYWETYLIHIYHMSKCSKCNWNRYINKGFWMWNVHFRINGLSPNIAYELTFNGNLFSFIKLLTIFCADFILYLMVINSKKYKSKYPNTIWWTRNEDAPGIRSECFYWGWVWHGSVWSKDTKTTKCRVWCDLWTASNQ